MEGICFLVSWSWTKHAIRVYVGTGGVSPEQDNGQVRLGAMQSPSGSHSSGADQRESHSFLSSDTLQRALM